MGRYMGTDNEMHDINLLSKEWEYNDCVFNFLLRFNCGESIRDIFKYDAELSIKDFPFEDYLEVGYKFDENDALERNPLLMFVGYEKGCHHEEVFLELNKVEEAFFQRLLEKSFRNVCLREKIG